MSKAFLPTILEQKEKEVAQLVMEDLQPLRQTYRLYEFLKSNQNKLQIISEGKEFNPETMQQVSDLPVSEYLNRWLRESVRSEEHTSELQSR